MLTATHTHSGPGGYSHYLLYNLSIPGFVAPVHQAIVDGIVAMARTGPRFGDPYPLGLLVASVDPVAVDRVLCDVLAIPADDLPFIPAARQLGVGETDMANIAVEGLSVEDARVADFALPTLIPATFSPLRLVRSVVNDIWSRRAAASL